MSESVDKTKHHFIRGIVKKDNLFYAPLVQVSLFCRRFPDMTAKRIGDMINDAINGLESNEKLLKKVPEVKEIDGGINGKVSEKEA